MTTASSPAPGTAVAPRAAKERVAKERVDWVDFAKAICMFFVVMLHANMKLSAMYPGANWLQHVVDFALPFRMPDFFLLAALFLPGVIGRPWRGYIDKKVLHFLYFYFLWFFIELLLFDVRYYARAPEMGTGGLQAKLWNIFVNPGGNPMWFIYELPIFFVLTRLAQKVPWWLMLAGAALLQSFAFETGWTLLDQFALRYVYFYSGYCFATRVFRLAAWARANVKWALVYLGVWALFNAYMVHLGWERLPGLSLLLGYVGAMAVIFTAAVVSTVPSMRWLRVLGEQSLAIYLGHSLLLALLRGFMGPAVGALGLGWAALATTVFLMGASLLGYFLLRGSFLKFLYVRPAWATLGARPVPVAVQPVP